MRNKLLLIVLCCILSISLMACKQETQVDEEQLPENPVADMVISDFTALDFAGNEVTEDIFTEHKLTVINLWGKFCGPCIRELPDLQQLYEDYQEQDVNVVGIIVDVFDNEGLAEAQELLEQAGVTYLNILPDETLRESLINAFDYVPASLLVDSEATIQKKFTPGANIELLIAQVDEYLEK